MATKKHYTKEFKRKVVDEYKNSNLSIEELVLQLMLRNIVIYTNAPEKKPGDAERCIPWWYHKSYLAIGLEVGKKLVV